MAKIKKTIVLSIVLTFLFSFIVFAREGMVVVDSSDEEVTYVYAQEDKTYLKNDWKEVWGNWYYFGDDGISKQSTWFEINEKWYYFDEKSVMLHDTVTPDGYHVGTDGTWITE